MTDKVQCRRFVPRLGKRAASAAYGFVMILLTVVSATWPAQAQTFTVLYQFNGSDGSHPIAGLLLDGSGNLYGDTSVGGASTFGTVFKVNQTGDEVVLLSFDVNDGAFPSSSLIMDKDGSLYSTALEGPGGAGVLFKLSSSGKETILHNFEGGIGTKDPKVPESGLVMDGAGNLYGTTISGGDSSCATQGTSYCGTVFRLAKNRKLTVLHSFTGGADGAAPYGSLLMDKAGNLYGTTYVGGDLSCKLQGENGCGVVFKLDPSGKETVLHTFTGKADGAFPIGGGVSLVADAAGNLYGAAAYAGAFGGQCGIYGCGTVFKVDKNGKFSVLHTFSKDGTEGETPNGALALDPAGNVYGTTQTGGAFGNYGTIFKVSKTGKLTVLHSFNGGSDGANPFSGLIRDSAGNLYGTTYQQFTFFHQGGTVFKVTP